MRIFMIMVVLITSIFASKYDKVKITDKISQVLVFHKGKSIRIHRIQDVKNHLTGTYAKISQPCPGRCIRPINMTNGVETVGEVEVISFIKNRVNEHKGALIDARPKSMYDKETIPSAINIPFTLGDNKKAMNDILKILGMERISKGKWNDSKALEVMVYCNGPWCEKSSKLINSLIKMGYPTNKIYYYRGGFQMWKSLGLTTVKTK